MAQRARKGMLVVHVSISVGWLGAVVAFLAVAIVAAAGTDAEVARACTVVMEVLGWIVLVPLSGAALLTGIVQALITPWGLFRHYWVVAKLAINVVATAVLLMYMQALSHVADRTGPAAVEGTLHQGLQAWSPVLHASAALVLLVLAVVLSVYKPKGMTGLGQRQQRRIGEQV
jgi:hypothetical protein